MVRIAVRSALFVTLFSAALVSGIAAAQSPHTHDHSFGDAGKWVKIFDDPKRDVWQKPHQVINALALRPDAVIADIGSGTGYFADRPQVLIFVNIAIAD